MRRRGLLAILAAGALAALNPAGSRAGARVARIGWLSPGSIQSHGVMLAAFRRGLAEHGYREGRDLLIEYRWADGQLDRLPELARELVRLKVEVIVTASTPATEAAKAATATIPIVSAVTGGDPVAAGFVASLARPGGNITGLSSLAEDLTPKTLEILHTAVPAVRSVAILANPANPWYERYWRDAEAAAAKLGLRLARVDARSAGEIEPAFQAITRLRPGALIVFADPLYVAQRVRIVGLAARHRLPAFYPFREFVEAGGLLSYGVSLPDNYRRSARFVDRILKGARPAELPMEQPTTFELVINLRAAQALNLAIPRDLLVQATETIR